MTSCESGSPRLRMTSASQGTSSPTPTRSWPSAAAQAAACGRGMDRGAPQNLARLDNDEQETWNLPLREYIEQLYLERLGKDRSDVVWSIEERLRHEAEKKTAGREAKRLRNQAV